MVTYILMENASADSGLNPEELPAWIATWEKAHQCKETMRYHDAERLFKEALRSCANSNALYSLYMALELSQLYYETERSVPADIILSKAVQMVAQSGNPTLASVGALHDAAELYGKLELFQKALHVAQLCHNLIGELDSEHRNDLLAYNRALLSRITDRQEKSPAKPYSYAEAVRQARQRHGILIEDLEALAESMDKEPEHI